MNPRELWQGQATKGHAMTVAMIHTKARDLRAKTRRQLLGLVVGPAAVLFFYGFALLAFKSIGAVLQAIFAIALVWSVTGLYFGGRGAWGAELPPDAGLQSGLAFCGQEIRRRQRVVRGVLWWSLGPILLSISALVGALAVVAGSAGVMARKSIPFLSLVVIWVIAYFLLRWREERHLQRELRDLESIAD